MRTKPNESAEWFQNELKPHEPSLRAYLLSSLPSRGDVDDVIQESYLKAIRVRESNPVHNSKALLFKIARNAVCDQFRHRRRVRMVSVDHVPLQDIENVAESVSRKQELAILREAIDALPARCKEVLLMKKIGRKSQKEIAQQLGISTNTVEVLIAKGTRKCREYFQNYRYNESTDP